MSSPVIISAAVTGAAATKKQNANLPVTPEEIGRDAVAAWRAGAAIVHIHARDDAGTPSWEAEYFQRALAVVKQAECDVIMNLTTSWGGSSQNTPDECRFAPLALRTELASFDCGSLNFGETIFRNSLPFLRTLAGEMRTAGVKPEIEIFDAGMIATAERLVDEGLLDGPLFFQFVLGVPGGAPATPRTLLHLIDSLPDGSVWSACALGRAQQPINALAIALGGHVRTGMEDNLWLGHDEPATNPALVERACATAALFGRPTATPDEARATLGLSTRTEATA